MNTKTTKVVNDSEEIKTALIEKGQLMRLKPSDRGAKRATIQYARCVINPFQRSFNCLHNVNYVFI